MKVALVVVVCLGLLLAVLPATAEPLEWSGVYGSTVGVGVGLYWPLLESAKWNASVGPMAALAIRKAVVGVGAQVKLSIPLPVFAELDFGWVGMGCDLDTHETGWEFGVGRVVK